jgi:hypothetical protein
VFAHLEDSAAGTGGVPVARRRRLTRLALPWIVAEAWIMVRRLLRRLSRHLDRRSRSAGSGAARRPRREAPHPTLQLLERRDVPSSLSRLAPIQADGASGFVPMFNGVNTAGWFIPYDWGRAVVRNGQILLTGDKNFFLVSRQTYKNFILEADVLIPRDGNSGLQFRSQYAHDYIEGYQADVDTTRTRNWAGGLWSQERGWLVRAKPRAAVIAGQWNHYVVEASGDHIQIIVNGKVTVDTENNLVGDGHIALQDHGTQDAIYRFKNVQIEDLGN